MLFYKVLLGGGEVEEQESLLAAQWHTDNQTEAKAYGHISLLAAKENRRDLQTSWEERIGS